MTLAAALLLSLAVAAAAALAARRTPPRVAVVWTLVATLAPLAALWLVAGRPPPEGAAFRAQLVGQYAPLRDTLRLGTGRGADVRLPTPDDRPLAVRAAVAPDGRALDLRVDAAATLLLADGAPVNALPLGRSATIRIGGARGEHPLEIRSATPAWPLGCLLSVERACGRRHWTVRDASGAERTLDVPVTTRGTPAAALGDPRLARLPLVVLLHDGDAWLAAGPQRPVTVDGRPVPSTARVAAPATLAVGGAGGPAVRLEPDAAEGRLRVRYVRRLAPGSWPLPAANGVGATWRVDGGATGGADDQPGTLPRLALGAEAPLGPRAAPYDGALAWTGAGWRWHAEGRTHAVPLDADVALPGTGPAANDRGHLLRLAPAEEAANPLPLLAAFWLLGALLLAADAAHPDPDARAVRVGLLGAVHALLLARGILAVRVTRAAPFSDEAVPTMLLLLAAMPLLAWLLARWEALPGLGAPLGASNGAPLGARLRAALGVPGGREMGGSSGGASGGGSGVPGARGWGAWRGAAVPAGAALLVVAAAAAVWGAAGGADRAAFVLLVPAIGTLGLAGLHRVVVPGAAQGAARLTPLGFLAPHSDAGFGRRHLARTVLALLVLVALYVALVLAPRGLSVGASFAAYAAAVAWVWTAVRERAEVRARLAPAALARRLGLAALAGGALGASGIALARPASGFATLAAAAGAGAALAAGAVALALLPRVRAFRAWPYRVREVLPPAGYVALPAALLLVTPFASVSRLGITLGFALACAGLLLVVRVVTVLWYAETRERTLAAAPVRRMGWWIVPAALSVYGGYLAADRGLVLLLLVAVLTTVVFGAATLGRRRVAGALALLAGVLVTVGVALHAPVRRLPDARVSLATPQMRHAAVHAPERLEAQALVAPPAEAREIVATLQQDWGMRAYAALGGTWGRGLYGVPYAPRALSVDVALTDNVFALWVLAEHGFAGAAALLLTYLAIAGALLVGAWHATRRYGTVHRAILLGGLATYVLTPALYMAAANASLLPLTGQNLPGLGLRSGADAAFVAWLVALALAALPRAAAGEGTPDGSRDWLETRASAGAARRVRRALGATAGVAAVLALVVGAAAWRATHAAPGPFALEGMADSVRTLVARGALRVDGDSIAVAPDVATPLLAAGSFGRELVARSNAFADGRAERRTHCLDRLAWLTRAGREDSAVRVSDLACRVTAPLPNATWRGALLGAGGAPDVGARAADGGADASGAKGAKDATGVGGQAGAGDVSPVARTELVVAGARLAVRLSPDGGDVLATCADTGTRVARTLTLVCGASARARVRLDGVDGATRTPRARVVLDGEARLARARRAGAAGGAAGAPNAVADGVPLSAGDVLAFDALATFVVDSVPRGAYAHARWRNGDVVRVATPGAPPFLAALDTALARGLRAPLRTAAADDAEGETTPGAAGGAAGGISGGTARVTPRAVTRDATPTLAPVRAAVALTLDDALTRELQARLAARCAGAAGGRVRQCAAILVDPSRGDVIAVASWERPGWRPRDDEPLDANFRAARGASAVKPLLAAAVLARYPRLRTLEVAQPDTTFVAAAGWPLGGTPFAAARHGCGTRVGWTCALPGSNNVYAVTLGLLGLAPDGAPGPAALPRLDRRAAAGPAFLVDGRAIDRRVALPTRKGGAARAASPLARGMTTLFDARVVDRATAAFDTTPWAPLRARGVLAPLGASWQRVSPAAVQLPLAAARYDTLRNLAGFLIGERDNLWSNAALARAMARLTTGRAVELRLVRAVGDTALPAPRWRALPFGPARAAVLDGMRGVVRGDGDGTGARAGRALGAAALDLYGKTGTAEGDGTPRGPTPVSRFVFGGRARTGMPATLALCPAVGAVLVEHERDGAGRLPAVELFADEIAPVLARRLGWDGTSGCAGR